MPDDRRTRQSGEGGRDDFARVVILTKLMSRTRREAWKIPLPRASRDRRHDTMTDKADKTGKPKRQASKKSAKKKGARAK